MKAAESIFPISPAIPDAAGGGEADAGGRRGAEERALAGDRAAWEELFSRHNRKVVVALLARGLPIDRARELAQEAWLRLIERQRAGGFDRLVLPALVVRQALLLARDRARSARARRPHLSLDDAEAWLADEGVRLEERLVSREQLARADEVLAGCSRSARRVFQLLYERPGTSHREVAERVGLSVQRVRQILCEVRKKLRSALEESDD